MGSTVPSERPVFSSKLSTRMREERREVELEQPELDAIRDEYGDHVLARAEVEVSKGYAKDKAGKCQLFVDVPIVESALVSNLVESFKLPESIAVEATSKGTLAQLSKYLTETKQKQDEALTKAQAAANQVQDEAEKAAALQASKTQVESEQAKAFRSHLTELLKHQNLGMHIWRSILSPHFPKFLYFDEYYQMAAMTMSRS